MDFWISQWISGFQLGFLDFWISQWISGFQFGFLPMVYEISFVTDPSFNSSLHLGAVPSGTLSSSFIGATRTAHTETVVISSSLIQSDGSGVLSPTGYTTDYSIYAAPAASTR